MKQPVTGKAREPKPWRIKVNACIAAICSNSYKFVLLSIFYFLFVLYITFPKWHIVCMVL